LNPTQVIDVLTGSAIDLKEPGWDEETGFGVVNFKGAIDLAKEVAPQSYAPAAFLNPTTWGGEGKVTPLERAASDEFNGKWYDWESHTIQSGETLSQIALDRMGSYEPDYYNFIAQHNGIADANQIYAGDTIEIPKEVSAPVANPDPNQNPSTDPGIDPNQGGGTATNPPVTNGYEWELYTVKDGESLSGIAQSRTGNASDYQLIANYSGNNIPNPDLIYAGDQIWVPKGTSGSNTDPTNQGGGTTTNPPVTNGYEWELYTVKDGESLSGIAQSRTGNASDYQLIANYSGNNIPNPDLIHAGDQIWVPKGTIPSYELGGVFSNTYSNNNWLGKPTSDLIDRGGVKIQYFENGHIIWNGVNFEAYKQGNGTGSNSVSLPSGSQGIDVSGWQGNVNWQSVKNDGYSFAFVKATEGTGFTDQQFAQNWQGTKNAGVVRGAYHYFHPDLDPVAQANHFINTIGTLAPNDLPPVLDLEHADNLSATTVLSKAQQWLDVVENTTGRKPIVYTYPSFWKDNLGNTQQFSDYPLWIANYTSASGPIVPGGWKNWTFWQYSDSGRVNGISGNVDLNKFSSNASSSLGNPVPTPKDEFFPIGALGEHWGAGNSVSSTNRNDYYSFNIDKRSNLQANLTGIDTNALLSIRPEGGEFNPVKTSGSASWILEPGKYQIKIEDTSGDTDYNFNLHRVNLVGDIQDQGLTGRLINGNWEKVDEDKQEFNNGVNLYRYDNNGKVTDQGIEAGKNTIVVIHGRGDSVEEINRNGEVLGTNIRKLLKTLAGKYESQGYQVLGVDWNEPANDGKQPPFDAARRITPVAEWTKNTLDKLGIVAKEVSLFGHSLGSYVSAEIGRLFGKVENLVAIDPAYPGSSYDIDGNTAGSQRVPEFKDTANHSLAFVVKDAPTHTGGTAGDGHTADKAKDSLVIKYDGSAPLDPIKRMTDEHKTAVDVVADAFLKPDGLKLENNLALPSDLWKDKYGDSGNYVKWSGTHEGLVTATRDGKIEELAYVNGSSWGIDQETTIWT